MAKKTAASRTRPRAASSQPLGLIAKATLPPRSAGAKPALDDHSHRTGPSRHPKAPLQSVFLQGPRLSRHVAGWVEGRLQRPEPEAPCYQMARGSCLPIRSL